MNKVKMTYRRFYLIILLNIIIVSGIVGIVMADAKKKDDHDKIENQLAELKTHEAKQYYGYFQCFNEKSNMTMFYDENVDGDCIQIHRGSK